MMKKVATRLINTYSQQSPLVLPKMMEVIDEL